MLFPVLLRQMYEYGHDHVILFSFRFFLTDSTGPTISQCDDVLPNCETVNKTLGVCSNFDGARKTCARFCGLCGIGKTRFNFNS